MAEPKSWPWDVSASRPIERRGGAERKAPWTPLALRDKNASKATGDNRNVISIATGCPACPDV
eukprot:CAMPEP_0197443108 /NCGR_PEP_ID=MMETSP1175-20131217/8955_1 /TAXON_ID=1003142 /ORGANISM="Triceratium dubium, Strain CCMP147" /LENGTH=62 /DNA_ID=CAMNT_0042973701 /DNA_START=353 /DNA_END=538 /DNA_ORIENTATION=-